MCEVAFSMQPEGPLTMIQCLAYFLQLLLYFSLTVAEIHIPAAAPIYVGVKWAIFDVRYEFPLV